MKILLIYTGGTIGMVHDADSGSYIPFDFENLQAQIPELNQLDCALEVTSYEPSIDSSNMHPKIWVQLGQTIEENYDKYDGFVILHGSDTMAYTSSALSFILENLNKPVILTGSQLPSGVPRTDAKENLITAIEIAASQRDGKPEVPEVAVYFEYQLYRGNRTHKVNAEHFEAFESVNYPALAEAGVHIKFNRRYTQNVNDEKLIVHKEFNPNIGVLKLFPGITESTVNCILTAPKTEGIILESYGSGNAPTYKWFLKAIKEATEKGIIILNVSQCQGGSVDLGRYETSKALKDMGVLSAYDMTFEAALTKLMFVLEYSKDTERRMQLLTTNLQGELTC
jgi:L-asparaginase